MSLLSEWAGFYDIVGSAAGALVGLQFVVLTLMAQSPVPNSADAAAAFGSPTIVHLTTPLFVAAVLRAPWHGLIPIAALWGLIGAGGTIYAIIVAIRMARQQKYSPVFEDWLYPDAKGLTLHGDKFWISVGEKGAVQIKKNGVLVNYDTSVAIE